MSDINISVDGSEVIASTAQLEKLEAVFAKTVARVVREQKQLERAFKQPFEVQQKAIQQASAVLEGKYFTNLGKQASLMLNSQRAAERQAEAEAKLTQELEKQAIAAQKAKSDTAFALGAQRAREEAAALEQLNAAKAQQAAREDFLRSKYEQGYAALRVYKTEISMLNEALEMGVLDQQKYAQAVDALNDQLRQGSGLFSAMNLQGNMAARQTNQLGVVVQQTGYQVGDFLVQIQSGTNVLVAFGQQATQLVGTIPLIADEIGLTTAAAIGLSTALGIGIPLVTAIGAAWVRTSEAQNAATESTKRLEEAQKSLNDATYNTQVDIDKVRFGVDEEYQVELLREQISLRQQINDKYQEASRISESFGNDERARADYIRDAQFEIDTMFEKYQQITRSLEAQNNLNVQWLILEGIREQRAGETAARLAEAESRAESAARRAEELASAIEEGRAKAAKLASILGDISNSTINVAVNFQASFSGFTGKASEWASGIYGTMQSIAEGGSPVFSSPRPRSAPNDPDFGLPEIGSGSSGGGSGGSSSRIESLISELQTERETLEAWNEEYTLILQEATDKELEMLGGRHQAKLRLEEEYQSRLREILGQEKNYRLNEMGNMFSSLADLAGVGGKKMLKVQATLSAASATIAAYETAIKAAAEAKTIPGRIAAYAKFLATGLGAVKAIRSAGGIGGGGGGGSPSSATVNNSGGAPDPQTVYIDALQPEALYSGQTLINLFEAFYNENDKRGRVFIVAR